MRRAASKRRSCRRYLRCRRRRGWSTPCCPPLAARRCPRRTWRSWRPPRGWSRSPGRCPCKSARRSARCRCNSGRGRSIPPGGYSRCPRSSTAGWTLPPLWWRSRWWRSPTAHQWLWRSSRNWCGIFWPPLGLVAFPPSWGEIALNPQRDATQS